MQKLILDTNILVSALISNSIPTKILYELVLLQKVKTCLSDAIFSEYVAVMNRKKFVRYANFKTNVDIVLSKLRELSIFYKTDAMRQWCAWMGQPFPKIIRIFPATEKEMV